MAALEGNEVLILGAFGCGAFRNPPDVVADVFRKISDEYSRHFETLEYAVFLMDRETENYKAFKRVFSKKMKIRRGQGFCGFIILTGNPTPAATRR